jgi:hypothetical protein
MGRRHGHRVPGPPQRPHRPADRSDRPVRSAGDRGQRPLPAAVPATRPGGARLHRPPAALRSARVGLQQLVQPRQPGPTVPRVVPAGVPSAAAPQPVRAPACLRPVRGGRDLRRVPPPVPRPMGWLRGHPLPGRADHRPVSPHPPPAQTRIRR